MANFIGFYGWRRYHFRIWRVYAFIMVLQSARHRTEQWSTEAVLLLWCWGLELPGSKVLVFPMPYDLAI